MSLLLSVALACCRCCCWWLLPSVVLFSPSLLVNGHWFIRVVAVLVFG